MINVPFLLFNCLIPGERRLPKFKVEVGYTNIYDMCRIMDVRATKTNIEIHCKRTLRGRKVTITTLAFGRLSLCEVAVYGSYG